MTTPAQNPNAVIFVDGLRKTYNLGGQVVNALDGVTLTINRGDLIAITGPSGSGKSTLMNIIGCLDYPDAGSYFLDGEDVSRLGGNRLAEIRNEKIGFVFQSFNLLPRMTALENVELPMLYAGAHGSKNRAREALQTVGLGDRGHHQPNQLSGGQRQRVAVARAIVLEPSIILADEPTGNLDSRTGKEILALFKELNDSGRTIVIVTHDPDVSGFCKRQITMRDGKVVAER